MSNPYPFPAHMRYRFHDWRAFKSMKRQELKDLREAHAELSIGSAYCPQAAARLISRIGNDLDELKGLLSVKEWGR